MFGILHLCKNTISPDKFCIFQNHSYICGHKSDIPVTKGNLYFKKWKSFIWSTTTSLCRSCLCACAGEEFSCFI